jgi:hypothetical protein
MFSFLLRLLVAYLFFVAGCLGLEFIAGGGSLRWRDRPEPAGEGVATPASL